MEQVGGFMKLSSKLSKLQVSFLIFFALPTVTLAAHFLKLPYIADESRVVTRGYGVQTHVGQDIYAIDFTQNGCDSWDQPVLAVDNGIVSKAETGHVHGEKHSYGNQVMIDHNNGFVTRYAHLNQVLVEKGQVVNRGEIIGTEGNTGSVSGVACPEYPGTHLHFVVYKKLASGQLVPHKPEPMSGHTHFAPGKWYTSDNELYDPNDQPPPSTIPTSTTQQPTRFVDKIKKFFTDLFSSDTPETSSEEADTVAPEEDEELPDEQVEPVYDGIFTPGAIALEIVEGQTEVSLQLYAKNTGNVAWQTQALSLNVVGGQDANAEFYHPSWITSLRPASIVENTVEPGEVGTFSFAISIPEDTSQTFRLQLVRQDGVQFLQVGNTFANITFSLAETPEPDVPQETEPTIPIPQESKTEAPTFFEQLEEIQEVLGEKIEETIETIIDLVPDFLPIGGENSEPTAEETTTETPVVEEEEGEEKETVVLPAIAITSPTTSPYIATTTPVTISGTFNSSTEYITINNATSTAFALNTSTYEWSINISDITEGTTTTYSFIAWSASGASSTPASVDIAYIPEEEIVELAEAPTILIPTQQSSYTTNTISLALSGTAATGTASVVYDMLGVTTSVSVEDSQWSTSVRFPGTGSYDIVLHGLDASGTASATSSIQITIERELNFADSGVLAISEIAWMGTESSANDEWFEIMVVPSGNGSTQADGEGTVYIVWGAYDESLAAYEHSVSLNQSVIDAWSQAGPPIQVFDQPGFYMPLHPSFVFERTDQSTLSNANGIIYTGALGNDGERILVLTDAGVILDDVDMSSGWAAGDNDTKESMVRLDLSGNSWCTYSSCPDTEYIGEQIITDADGNLVSGSPYSPYQLVIPEF